MDKYSDICGVRRLPYGRRCISAARRAIHVIADNLPAHETKIVQVFLNENNVTIHFTPAYSLRLNQVELWFSKIERDLIARAIFTSVRSVGKKIRVRFGGARDRTAIGLS